MLSHLRKASALLLLAALGGLAGWLLWDQLRSFNGQYLLLATLGLSCSLLTLYGVARNRSWGRWAGLSIAVGGALCMGSGMLLGGRLRVEPLALMGGFLLLGACLVGSSMAARYEGRAGAPLATRGRGGLVRWGTILALSATPMLLVYGLLDSPLGFSAGMRAAALLIGGAIPIGAALIHRGRTAGALLLLLAGLGSLGLGVAQLLCPADGFALRQHVFFASNWMIAALGSLVLVAALAGPAVRFLRRGAG